MFTNVPGRAPIELPHYYEEFAWYYPNCEMQTKAWFVEHAQPGWVYLDCGANIGYYSILFSQLSPEGRVHAFEPTSTADMLEKNLQHHSCPNVAIHRVALGQHPGTREERIFRLWGQEPEKLAYPFSTIDEFVLSEKPGRLDCLKIDVDSFDFEVLQGAESTLRQFDPWVVVELNHALGERGYSPMAAVDWLATRGYQHALVLDHDNFILRRSAPPRDFATSRQITLNFPPT
ncbi:MAG: hypothetical protein C0518_00615 [Opitutus sp.]|nr:hypothetical protein [Opitutus sp.]